MSILFRILVAIAALVLTSCASSPDRSQPESRLYAHPQRVAIVGYDGHAMEPFLSRDGRYLLFNNLNDPAVDTNLHYAERVDDLTFRYRGELAGVNTPALDGVPTLDRRNNLYFVSLRSYESSLSTIHRGVFSHGRVAGVALVPGLSRKEARHVNFDVDVSPDGSTLYFVDARFGRSGPETADLVVAQRQGEDFVRRSDSAVLLQQVNTDALEYAPCISADGLTLLFTRARLSLVGGSVAIYMAQRTRSTEPFGPPARLAALDGLVEAPTFTPDERAIYFHRKDGAKYVIYRASR